MKVILLEDVYKQGVAGEIVDVAAGYARNFLIPQGKAVKATPGMLKQMQNLRKQADVRRAERKKEFTVIAEKIEELTLYFGVKAGETGKLYGSVTTADIAERLKEQIGLEIDHRRVGDQPLRELGTHSVAVRLDGNLQPDVTVVIHREDEDPLAAAEITEEEAEAQEQVLEEAQDAVEEMEASAEEVAEEAMAEIEEISEDI